MVILYISFPVCLEKQEKRGASVKIRKRGLSSKWAEFSFARGQSGPAPGSIGMSTLDPWKALWGRGWGGSEGREKKGDDPEERLGRIFTATRRPSLWVPYRLQCVTLNKPPKKPRRRQWSVQYEGNTKATSISVFRWI